ncbi:LacI family DNA-binding transcriptional regulator [Actibacterium pelagium]|uniref:LacI family transcriptional regulator n=1 Tax=Actibacterium pelagium TaxID=2029103 RepID=A0A917ANJ8_9RHOB|nr:LacI family DNA-binding transcriptional regulator [Actibacterium pelagium]GGE61588.1 LacI family transcriptional regulator [Actibacterium pelagium]
MDEKNRVTLADVAAAAGVSKMTASRALRGAGDVSARSIEKVRQTAKDIGYVGNHLASSLSGKRSDLIGVLVPSLANIVFAEVLSGIAEGIEGSGLQPVFGVTDYDLEKEYNIIRSMLSWNPAGLIVTGLDQSDDSTRLLKNADIPVVQIMDVDGTPVDACVGLSHYSAGEAMAETLIAMGRSRIGYIGCDLNKDTRAQKRLEGFKRSLAKNGLSLVVEKTSENPSAAKTGRDLTALALAEEPDLDGIYYSNDDLAAGGAFHCIACGISVPERVALAGFNGLDLIDSLPVKIITSRTPRREIGKTAVEFITGANRTNEKPESRTIAFTPSISVET